jgi:hypothetical protein
METYFSKFPSMVYNNITCTDITRRVKIVDKYLRIPNSYYSYEIQNHERPDLVAELFYDDSYYDWLIYLTNNTVDPFYSWYLDNDEFNNLMKSKYGSVESAIKQTSFYRNNWYNDSTELTPSFFNNTLAQGLKKYYTPNFGINTKIISYKRKSEDWTVNTNKLMVWNITYNSGNSFTAGEIIDIKYNAEVIGGAEIISSNTTSITIQHVSGITNTSVYIVGETSGSNANLTSSITTHENITDEEAVFWERVSVYDYENELNESRKNINLIESSFALPVAEKLIEVLGEE